MLVPSRAVASLVLAGSLSFAACSHGSRQNAAAAPSTQFNPEVTAGLAQARAATARFAVLDSAVAAGYARDVPRCFADPHHGAMGFHHLNRGYVDERVEVERPEILLYERHADGRYQLNGVEYIIPFTRWPRDSVPPTIMGMDMKREEDLRLWYLHMWLFTDNASGIFADWNPAVKCPASP